MPKVTEEYIRNKKKMIVETAYNLCLRKTVSTVTMQDIINQTGLSQGGIYRFYKDIDEIFADMMVYSRQKYSIKGQVDEIIAMGMDLPPKQIINLLFDMFSHYMMEELIGVEKINFEMSILAMNAPNRIEKIMKNAPGVGNMEYMTFRTMVYLTQQMQEGRIKPRVSSDELLSYITSAYTGIQSVCITNSCYQHEKDPLEKFYRPDILLRTLAQTVNYLIGEEI